MEKQYSEIVGNRPPNASYANMTILIYSSVKIEL